MLAKKRLEHKIPGYFVSSLQNIPIYGYYSVMKYSERKYEQFLELEKARAQLDLIIIPMFKDLTLGVHGLDIPFTHTLHHAFPDRSGVGSIPDIRRDFSLREAEAAYMFWSSSLQPLYAGATNNIYRRLVEHEQKSMRYFPGVSYVSVFKCRDRLALEKCLVYHFAPILNHCGVINQYPEMCRDYLKRLEEGKIDDTYAEKAKAEFNKLLEELKKAA